MRAELLLSGKKALILGIANERSIAWGIARSMHEEGAGLALTYQNESIRKRVDPLGRKVGAEIVTLADVSDPESLDSLFDQISEKWGRLDALVHAIAYSDRTELNGRFIDTSRENFAVSLDVSCIRYSASLTWQGGPDP